VVQSDSAVASKRNFAVLVFEYNLGYKSSMALSKHIQDIEVRYKYCFYSLNLHKLRAVY